MKILKLKLRGAIGIRKGLGKEEVEIDFTNFQPGLIALTGKNGSGKTTIMENLHPYRTMVSRTGSLQSHFYLKDSYRILEFEQDGNNYQSKILIDALTGGSEAYLICNGEPLNDGKLSTYDEEIEKVLGSQELFFNSVFSGQKSKGIAELKPAERRKLFYELLNLTVYEQYLEKAKTSLKAMEIELAEIDGEIRASNLDDLPSIDELERKRVELLNEQAGIMSFISDIEDDIEKTTDSINELRVKVTSAKEKLSENDRIAEKLHTIEKNIQEITEKHNQKIKDYKSQIFYINEKISFNKSLVENRANIEANLSRKKLYEHQLNELQQIKSNIQTEQAECQKEYSEKLKEISEQEKHISSLQIEFNTFSNESKQLNESIERTKKEVETIDKVPCTDDVGSSCSFLINAFKGKKELENMYQKLREFDVLLSKKEAEIAKQKQSFESNKQIVTEKYQIADSEITEKLDENIKRTNDVQKKIDEINTEDWEKLSNDVKEAENTIKLLQEKISSIESLSAEAVKQFEAEIKRIKDEAAELNGKMDMNIQEKINVLKKKEASETAHKLTITSTLEAKRILLDENKASISQIEAQLEQIKQNESKINDLCKKRIEVQNEIKDWAFLCKAFDKTGIPVLKLENSGIEITTIANELLSLFENKFRIVFETTKLKADKKSYKESFDINIVEDDGVCEISNKSGGEKVWIETALQLAISFIVRQQDKDIKTTFLDEADGALDLNNAELYLEMLRKSHNQSDVHNTFIITHRAELMDLIPQQIKLGDGLLMLVN